MTFIDPSGFSGYSPYPSMTPTGVGGQTSTAVQSQCMGFPSFGGSNSFPQFNYGMQPPPQSSDSMGGFTDLIGQFMQLFMVAFMGGSPFGQPPVTEEPPVEEPSTEEPETGKGDPTDQPEGDPQLEAIQGEDPNTNSGTLNILSAYASDLPSKNGRVDMSALKKFAKAPPADIPEEVVTAVKNLVDNPDLYDLLCLKSGSTPEKGFKTTVLDTDWSKTDVDIDELESTDDPVDAVKDLKKVYSQLAALSPDAEGTGSDKDFTLDDLKDVALGKAHSTKLKDPTVQAAARALLSDSEAFAELDGNDDERVSAADLDRYITDNK